MATLVLSAVGSVVGGPIGNAVGAIIGSQIDRKLFGPKGREGPRLKELAVSTSSYGGPIPQQIGQLRSAGTIVWATDFVESSETSGGKGKPKVTSFSYSVSFAVALSSRPIDRLGRIWADGNLLRGAAGDLKTGGMLRVHEGHGDQRPDPLMAAALGAQCPAHRGIAYVVFESLDLSDFGNRIPALTFEIFAGSARTLVRTLAQQADGLAGEETDLPGIEGFSHEGGTLASALALLGSAAPLVAAPQASPLTLFGPIAPAEPPILAEPAAWTDGDFGKRKGVRSDHAVRDAGTIAGLRYYDIDRDYQPGVQRRAARSAGVESELLDLPASMRAEGARAFAERVASRERGEGERRFHRVATLDPAIVPGSIVRLPDSPGLWRVTAWEWREGGVEYELARHFARASAAAPTSSGLPWIPPDQLPGAPYLEAFEVPWDGISSNTRGTVYAAVGSRGGRWAGASLYAESAAGLVPLVESGRQRALVGTTAGPLPPSHALMIEPRATLEVDLLDTTQGFSSTTRGGISTGANRLRVGDEILQFLTADALGGGRWQLSGLLRGRGGTEGAASAGSPAGAAAVLLDERLVELDNTLLAENDRITAIDGDSAEPLVSDISARGTGQLPLSPVHGRVHFAQDGSVALSWTRRARGAWRWLNGVGVPLVEEAELYEIGCGPLAAPLARWETVAPSLTIDPATYLTLAASHPGGSIWVRQIGSYGRSPTLTLLTL